MKLGEIEGLFIGQVEQVPDTSGAVFPTAINKKPVASCRLLIGGLEGDQSSEADHHTPDKDAHFFASEHYSPVSERLGLPLKRPTFGENICTSGFTEADIYVGDRLAIGDAVLEVTQPTERCKTVGRNLGQPKILKIMHQLDICGFYARVVEPGQVASSGPITLLQRRQPDWSILRLHQFMFNRLGDEALRREVMSLDHLSGEWKVRVEIMHGRMTRGEPLSSNLIGL